MIRRNFYPSHYFKDQSFFDFGHSEDDKYKTVKKKIQDFFNIDNNEEIENYASALQNIKNEISLRKEIDSFHSKIKILMQNENKKQPVPNKKIKN